MSSILDPKQTTAPKGYRSHWYPYYAGFSPLFAQSALEYLNAKKGDIIVDPWNGSGTTTFVSARSGIASVGVDLNPVMTIVAKARSSTIEDYIQAKVIALDAIANFDQMRKNRSDEDMLTYWFTKESAKIIRQLEYSMRFSRDIPNESVSTGSLSDSEALVYLALFRVVRNFIKRFIGSNDTWIRKTKTSAEKVKITKYELISEFARETSALFAESTKETDRHLLKPKIFTGDSKMTPLSAESADFIITSPPYCTRIDYAVKTTPELAIIGHNPKTFDQIRRSLMGTTTVSKDIGDIDSSWGQECLIFLNRLKSHRSKASGGYYYKSHFEYFSSLYQSIREMDRILKSNGKAVLVIQDSYYKEIHNNVPLIAQEMAGSVNLNIENVFEFSKNLSMASINTRSNIYRPIYTPKESVLVFSKS